MKKYFKYLSALALVAIAMMSLSSCSEKELGETIFPDVAEELDPNSYTYNFDKWLKENYLDVYNMDFQYRLKDNETDMDFNLIPATLSNSRDMAVLTKYFWFDVYKEVTGSEEFVKMYGPRIIMLVGCPQINPVSGTQIQGVSEGGVKVTLFNVNKITGLNTEGLINALMNTTDGYIHTMHHEFAHILHQTKTIPSEFRILSLGHFEAMGWEKRNEHMVHSLGFFTPYGSSDISEDFAETISGYITLTDKELEDLLEDASYGWATDKEDSENAVPYYRFYYYPDNDHSKDKKYIEEKYQKQLDDGSYVHVSLTDPDGNPIIVYPVEDEDGVNGYEILMTKIQLCKDWFLEEWGIDLEKLRNVVKELRQNFDAAKLQELRQQVTMP